uniref:BACK domain-containing protein n=1 Tax=Panagrellus redivivus TaxID=6233 RepID=A0A7E4VK35_PANRE
MRNNTFNIFTCDHFKKLSTTALTYILKDSGLYVPDIIIFRGFVEWMKANPAGSDHFPELLKHIKLNSISLSDVITAIRPLKLIDGNDFMDIVCEQAKTAKASYAIGNALTSPLDVEVNFNDKIQFSSTQGPIGVRNEVVTIDLQRLVMVNAFEMKLSDGDQSYWIEISEDNVIWVRIIDYSNYICRSIQRLHFEKHPVRFIRIHGTASEGTFEIVSFDAFFTMEQVNVDPETNIVIPSANVALADKNAIVIQGHDFNGPNVMLNGCTSDSTHTWHFIDDNPIIVQLPQPYLLDSMNLLLFSFQLPEN